MATACCSTSSRCCGSVAGPSGRTAPVTPVAACRMLARAAPARRRSQRAPLRPLASTGPAAAAAAAEAAAAAPAAATAAGFWAASPLASVTRIVMNQPTNMAKALTKGSPRAMVGPISLLLFLITVLGAAMAFVRHLLVRKVKQCQCCRGFGIQRCRLCAGEGRVDWHAKQKYASGCPMCMNKRFVTCGECGGYFHRTLFVHSRRTVTHAGQDVELVPAVPQGANMPKQALTLAND